jgi:diguanylate cyclase (GGDEF)-like protein
MLSVIVLLFLLVLFYAFAKRASSVSIDKKERELYARQQESLSMRRDNACRKAVIDDLDKSNENIIALYDLTKDVCAFLDPQQMFSVFRSHLSRFVTIRDCVFVRGIDEAREYPGYLEVPLRLHDTVVGFVLADGLSEKDLETFNILAGQFLLGFKRALLYERVQELVITDSLTGAMSRRYFLGRFSGEFKRSQSLDRRMSFLMIDIDHFKDINDRYGHLVGDVVLRSVSDTIRENIRQIDFMGRYGGEELAVVLVETDKQQAMLAAHRICEAVAKKCVNAYDESVCVSISIGVSTFPEDSRQLQGVFEKADKALYQAKHCGRNCVRAA